MKNKILTVLFLITFYNASLFSQNDAQFVSQTVPSSVHVGEIFDVSIAIKNTGTTTWTNEDMYFLGSQNPQDNDIWGYGSGRFSLPFDIAPGQTAVFNVTLTAPNTIGTYNFQHRMMQEHIQWFGDITPNVSIDVVANPNASLITFNHIPLDKQLIKRNINTNQGTVIIDGEVDNTVVNYEQIIIEEYRNNTLINTFSNTLTYTNNIAPFSFNINIPAELAEYTFKIYGKIGNDLTLEKTISDVVAGDAYIIQGQSNAEAMKRLEGTSSDAYQNEFIRVYASGTSNPATLYNDNKWYIAQGDGSNDTHGNTGQWGLKLANLILTNTNIPVAIFNGAHGGKEIAFFHRPPNYHSSIASNYARLYYRLNKTGLKDAVRAVLWSQGETDADIGTTTEEYINYFNDLKAAWLEDYPNIEHFYIFQTRIACSTPIEQTMAIREAQRLLDAENTDITTMQTAALTQLSDHCHFPFTDGYETFADRIFPLLYRDIYNNSTSADIEAPMIQKAVLINNTTIEIETNTNSLQLNNFNSDDYVNFVLTNSAQPTNIQVNGNKIIITLPQTPDRDATISYLGEYSGTDHFITNSNEIELQCFNKFPVSMSNTAKFISMSVPSAVHPNEEFTVSITYKNAGINTWINENQYRLGSQSPQDNQIWGVGRVSLPDSVPAGQEVTFTFNLTAPDTEGIYNFQWRLLQEHVEWFGDKTDLLAISVTNNHPTIDPNTLNNKVMFGYQGWFSTPDDGANLAPWRHYFASGNNQTPVVDLWPDISEFDEDELYDTGLTLPDGSPAKVPSAYTMKTVKRHMKWLADYELDGVFLQRFVNELDDPRYLNFRNQVLENVKLGCEDYGRVFAVMYDISSGANINRFGKIKQDWKKLVDQGKINSPNYLKHNGLPIVAIWGFGFTHHGYDYTPAEAMSIINFFKNNPNPAYRATVMGGVPAYWRERIEDSETDPAWQQVYESLDIISPWAVGRSRDEASADDFRANLLHPDKTYIDQLNSNGNNISYLPVAFPGFSWRNVQKVYGTDTPYNEIPRDGGRLFWRQAYNIIDEGINMLYIAMFDEIDEGTAMFKCAPTQAQVPDPNQFSNGTQFVSLDQDGYNLDSDFYLRLASCTAKILRGEEPLTSDLPTCEITHNAPPTVLTNYASNITQTTATLNGQISSDGGIAVTESGFVYSTSPNPVIGGVGVTQIQTSPTITIGNLSEDLNNLTAGTTYYYKAYAINSEGTSYGSERSFTSYINNSIFISQVVPSTVNTNETFTVSITFKNTGNTIWYPTGTEPYNLGSQSPQDNFTWGTNRMSIPNTVAPDEQVTITADLSAPSTAGIYDFQWRMVQEAVEWFGEMSDLVSIEVVDNTVTPVASISSTPACNSGSVIISSDLSGPQIFYLFNEDGSQELQNSGTVNAMSYEFTNIADGTYTGKVEKDGSISALSNTTELVNLQNTEIITQPANINANIGENVNFSVTANGSNLSYQWYHNSTSITGETNNNLFINNVQQSDAGEYTVVVSGDCGQLTSDTAYLNINTTNISAQNNNTINIYPNPVYNILYVKGVESNSTIIITDVCGKKILEEKLINNSIDLSSLENGIYILNISSDKENANFEIFKR